MSSAAAANALSRSEPLFKPLRHISEEHRVDLFFEEAGLLCLSILLALPNLLVSLFIYLFLGLVVISRLITHSKYSKPPDFWPASPLDSIWARPAVKDGGKHAYSQDFAFGGFLLRSQIDYVRLKSLIKSRLVDARLQNNGINRLQMKLMDAGHGRTVFARDTHFDIDHHVQEITALHENSTRQDLSQFITDKLMNDGLSVTEHSPWRAYVATPFGFCRATLVIFKYHIALADGIGLMRLMFNKMADSAHQERELNWLKPRFGHVAFIHHTVQAFLFGPLYVLGMSAYHFQVKANDINPLRPPGYKCSGQWIVRVSGPLAEKGLLKASKMFSCTIFELLMACLSAAFRVYFINRGCQYPPELTAAFAIDLHGPENDRKNNDLCLENKWIFERVKLPAHINGVLPMFWKQRKEFDNIKQSFYHRIRYRNYGNTLDASKMHIRPKTPHEQHHGISRKMQAVFNYGIRHAERISLRFFGASHARNYLLKCGARGCTTTVSYVAGPRSNPLKVDQAIVHELFGIWKPPINEDIPLAVNIVSYNGHVQIGLTADKVVMPDPDVLLNEFAQQIMVVTDTCQFRKATAEEALPWPQEIKRETKNFEMLSATMTSHAYMLDCMRKGVFGGGSGNSSGDKRTRLAHWGDFYDVPPVPTDPLDKPLFDSFSAYKMLEMANTGSDAPASIVG